MNLRIQCVGYEISYNKDFTSWRYKIIKIICKILTKYHSCQPGRVQIFFEGGAKMSFWHIFAL